MRHLLLLNAILLCACASQPPSAVQNPPASAAASFLAGDIPAPIQSQGSAEAAPVQTPQHPPPTAAEARDAAAPPTEGDASIAQLRTLSIEEAGSGRVCESVERPGSRMTRTVCYTREERQASAAAREEQRDGQLDELQREQRWRDEIIRQAEMSGRRPSGFGLGPN